MTAPREKMIDPSQYGVVVAEGTSRVCQLYDNAILALDAGNTKTARALYQRALSEEPTNAQAHIGLGSCASQEGDFVCAMRSYRDALALDPGSASAHVGLGSVHYDLKRFAEAAEHYERAIRLRDELPDAHWGAAIAFERLGNHSQMRAHAKRFLELAPESTLASRARALQSMSALRLAMQRLFRR